MKFFSRPLFICAFLVLLAVGLAGTLACHKKSREVFYRIMAVSVKVKRRFSPPPARSPKEIADHQIKCRVLKAKLVAEFPALKITPQPVPDAENGFWLLQQLAGPSRPYPPVSKEFKEILSQSAPWDPEIAKRCLAEHADLVKHIEHIAAVPTRSSSDLTDYNGYVGASPGKEACDILLVKARLAAEAKDEIETLRLVTAASHIGSHYHDVESPTLICETVAVLIDLSIQGTAFKALLPAIGRDADLGKWKSVLGQRTYTDFGKVLRGEWNTGADHMMIPLLLTAERDYEVPDAEAVIRYHSAMMSRCILEIPSRNLADLPKILQPSGDTSHLSGQGRKVIEILSIGQKSWAGGFIRAAGIHHQSQAALDLLILEKSGIPLTAASSERVTRDPTSGSPFIFDPASRKLDASSDTTASGMTSLALPW